SIPYTELGGPWLYYQELYRRHGLMVPEAKSPEIGVRAGSTLIVPLLVTHSPNAAVEITVTVPTGWKLLNGAGRLQLPAEDKTAIHVELATPELSKEELKTARPVEIVMRASGESGGGNDVRLRVQLKASALPQ